MSSQRAALCYAVTSWLTLGIELHTFNPRGICNMNNMDVGRVDPRVFLYLAHKKLGHLWTWFQVVWDFILVTERLGQNGGATRRGLRWWKGMEDRQFQQGPSLHGSCCWGWLRNIVWSTFVSREWVATPGHTRTQHLKVSPIPGPDTGHWAMECSLSGPFWVFCI